MNERPLLTTHPPFISFAQNGEDVVLNRALGSIENGTYIDVGANHPQIDSVSRSFYDRGWSGIAIEPNPAFAALFHSERPRDTLIEAAVTDLAEPTTTFHIVEDTGLSTLVDTISMEHVQHGFAVTDLTVPTVRLDTAIEESGLSGKDIHFLVVDVEGAELQVLRSVDLTQHRPWILIIEATSPGTTTPAHEPWESLILDADYEFCLFDGLSRFYVAAEQSREVKTALSYPVCFFDDYITLADQHRREELLTARNELLAATERFESAETEVASLRNSWSWRITSPLRRVGKLVKTQEP